MEKYLYLIICCYIILANVTAFALMGIDKKRAKQGKWRIKEKNLFLAALLGGSIGANVGMRYFHHKTKHWYFVVGMPAILVLHVVIAGFVLRGV